ncbi:Glia-derived nexin [Thelohanellus kitauei]|uniref:Glia-derived nexin n=1 Tax=Thelohanellus kitauei TaxID=669202 RepID=A0A0C2JZG7_THEKT|nr:Glia-derived nexin [Thelohanellus kitauei]
MSNYSVYEFGQAALSHLFVSQNHTGNIAFSAPSLYIIMSIINAGLGGRTRSKISQFLYQDVYELQYTSSWSYKVIGYILSRMDEVIKSTTTMKSAIFHSFDINRSFVNRSKELIDIEYHKCDFSNREKITRKINTWAMKNTRRLVHNLYRYPVDKGTKMIVLTTLYFFADWLFPFDPMNTKYEIFTDNMGRDLNVNMMSQIGSYRIYGDLGDPYTMIFIPLIKISLYATIVLPDRGSSTKDILTHLKWDNIQDYFHESLIFNVELKLPKFKITTKNRLINTLIHLNVSELFDPYMADFGFTTSKNISINDLMQITTVIVDELSRGIQTNDETQHYRTKNHVNFYVDRPFLFLVYSLESTHVVLSVLVNNPNAS